MTIIKGQKAIGDYIGYSVPSVQRNKDKCSIPYYRAGRNICARSEDLDRCMLMQIDKNWGSDKSAI